MENLGQFNLIVGDNNVGKTTVLEALTLETDRISLISKLILNYFSRNSTFETENIIEKNVTHKNFWVNVLKDINKELKISFEYIGKKEKASICFIENSKLNKEDINSITQQIPVAKQPELWVRYYLDDNYLGTFGTYYSEYYELVYSEDFFYSILRMNVGYNDNHVNIYYKTINPFRERRMRLESDLRFILKDLEEIRPHKIFDKEILGIVLNNDDKIYPITHFGDGLIKITRIVLGIFSTQMGRLMIDEIDVGIHFSKIKGYWKNIIELCASNNIQLFATTHSLECQQAFVEALEDPEMRKYQQDARNISLIENKQGVVEAITYDFDQFEYALNIGFNTRGGKL